jgi:endonuclease/exonuclease/phosphatase family metal-dependent hydrolase
MKHLLLLLSFSIFLHPLDLKIASYNVENLFDMEYNGSEYRAYIPNKHGWNYKNFRKKLLNISEVICDVNADIIGLEEVENGSVLKALQRSLRKIGCFYNYSAITHKRGSAIQIALLSKYPINSIKEIIVDRGLEYRNILEIKYIFNHKPFFIFVNHWKSKSSAESFRMLSAKALLKRLESLPKESEYILLGDFNSDYNEYRIIQRKHNNCNGKTGINHTLQTIHSNGLFVRPFSFKKPFEHYNLWLEVSNYKRWSHNFYGKKEGLDAILLPETLFDGEGIDYIENSFRVFKKRYLFHKKGYILRWVYKKQRHKGIGYSDHLPLFARFSTESRFKKRTHSPIYGSIEVIYGKNPSFPIRLKEVTVVKKEPKKVRIRESNSTDEIALYGVKNGLLLNHRYDIAVYGRKLYKGHYEIIDFEIEKSYDSSSKNKD